MRKFSVKVAAVIRNLSKKFRMPVPQSCTWKFCLSDSYAYIFAEESNNRSIFCCVINDLSVCLITKNEWNMKQKPQNSNIWCKNWSKNYFWHAVFVFLAFAISLFPVISLLSRKKKWKNETDVCATDLEDHWHDKTNKMTCVPSEDSDQPGHQPSLISLRSPHEETFGPWLPIEHTAKTLIKLGGCPGWYESLMGAQVICLVLWCSGWYINAFEPAHEIMALFVLHKFILQTPMCRHPVGLDVWILVGPFVYFHILCVQTAKALSLCWSPLQ